MIKKKERDNTKSADNRSENKYMGLHQTQRLLWIKGYIREKKENYEMGKHLQIVYLIIWGRALSNPA